MRKLIALAALLSMVAVPSALAGQGKEKTKVEVCKVADGVQSRVVVPKRELRGFFVRFPDSYLGDCKTVPTPPVFVPQVDRDGACASEPVFRVEDQSYGRFVDLDLATFNSGVYGSVTFTPAFFVQGLGETCDIPAGYHAAGYNVESSGKVNTAAPQFNVHPLYVRN